MQVHPPRGIREKLKAKLRARVRFWVDGHQVRYFDTYGDQWVEAEYPSYPSLKLLETVRSDRDVPVRIGKYTGIHYSTVLIPGGMHHFDWISSVHGHVAEDGTWDQGDDAIFAKGPITIGSDVFIAYEAVVTSGVTIGHGAVVGTRAVVTRDVEPYSIVAGNPARHVKYRFEEPVREALLRISWWDWPVEKVTRHAPIIHSNRLEEFIAAHDPQVGAPGCDLC